MRATKCRASSPAFPISHVLEFDAAAHARRETVSARLASEIGVPSAVALAAVEAFGEDAGKALQWLRRKENTKQVRVGTVHSKLRCRAC